MLDKSIENFKDNIVNTTCELINIPSVSVETENPDMPFGEGCKNALNYILDLGKKLGFKTKNVDNYCGYIEFGEGEKLIGLIGHLDVVPSGDGWNTPPFEATINDGKIYGRGSIDDKGPVVASLYAMKSIMDNYTINSRVRLIIGLNEEKSWKCINYYKEHEEWPSIGFSPDADFPCIYAEKGIATFYIEDDYSKYENFPIKITKIDCKNNAINVVPKFCEVNLNIDTKKLQIQNVIDFIKISIQELKFDIDCALIDKNNICITSKGVQAHSAHPNLGKNAISQLIILLNRVFTNFDMRINILDFFEKNIGMEFDGKSLGLNIEDESGALTLNVGHFKINESKIQLGLNLRIPVKTPITDVNNIISGICNNYELEAYLTGKQEPLYLSKTHHLVKTLTDIFNKSTNSNLEPIAIGGGTYARAFPNCVSFGANFPGDTDMCHQANEFVEIDKLVLASKIYAEAILALTKDSI